MDGHHDRNADGLRGNHCPSALNRGFRGKSNPLSFADPTGTNEQFLISYDATQRKR